MVARRGGEGRADLAAFVAQNAEIGDLALQAPQQCVQCEAVGIIETGGRQWLARRDDLVTGRKNRDFQFAPDLQAIDAERRCKRDIARPEPPPRSERHLAARNILAARATIGALLQPGGKRDVSVAGLAAIFLHEHRVEIFRHRRAGEDAHRALSWRCNTRVTRGEPAGDRQDGFARLRQRAEADGISVDGGIIEARQIDRRDQRFGKNAAVGFDQRNALRLGDWRRGVRA